MPPSGHGASRPDKSPRRRSKSSETRVAEKKSVDKRRKGEAQPHRGAPPTSGRAEDDTTTGSFVANTPHIDYREFNPLGIKPPGRGDTEEEFMHWMHPRRWKVHIWQGFAQNITNPAEKLTVYANFIFGGNQREYLVGPRRRAYIAGTPGEEFNSKVVTLVAPMSAAAKLPPPVSIGVDHSFEWHGSYMDLEAQELKVEFWQESRFSINRFDSVASQQLKNFAEGTISTEMIANQFDKFGFRTPRIRLIIRVYFQEIYDFHMLYDKFHAVGLVNAKGALRRVKALGDEANKEDLSMSIGASMVSMVGAIKALERVFKSDDASTLKRLVIDTPSNPSFGIASKRLRTNFAELKDVMWKFTKEAKVYFRGTCNDLLSAVANCAIYTSETKMDLPTRARRFVPRAKDGIPVSRCKLMLEGKLDSANAMHHLAPVEWILKLPGVSKAFLIDMGRLRGQVVLINQPRYRQLESVSANLDFDSKFYLHVKVLKISTIVSNEAISVDNIDTHVKVTFDKDVLVTKTVHNNLFPVYNDELYFELKLTTVIRQNKRKKGPIIDDRTVWSEISGKGSIYFDVWSDSRSVAKHHGRCCVSIADVIAKARDIVEREVFDCVKGVRFLKSRTYSCCQQLEYVWGVGPESKIYVELSFLRDLSSDAKLREIPIRGLAKVEGKATWDKAWERAVKVTDMQDFTNCIPSQWSSHGSFLLPQFLDTILPLAGIDTPQHILHFIGCIQYKEQPSSAGFTPDYLQSTREGDALAHALLHASFLIGVGHQAYVCLGRTLSQKRHAWVMTMRDDGVVEFWEPMLSTGRLKLPGRLANPYMINEVDPKAFSREDQRREMDRRKRLQMQKLDTKLIETYQVKPGDLVLQAEKLHSHPLVYADCLAWKPQWKCRKCKAEDSEYGTGYTCLDEKCNYKVCSKCAEPYWKDEAKLQQIKFDVKHPFFFPKSKEEDDPILPYWSIDVVFNMVNCWANKQNMDPAVIFYDLWDDNYWHPYAPEGLTNVTPCFPGVVVARRQDPQWITETSEEAIRSVRKAVTKFRQHRGLRTSWESNPMLAKFLNAGAELMYENELSNGKEQMQINKWQRLLEDRTPPNRKLDCHCVRFNNFHGDFVVDRMSQKFPDTLSCPEESVFQIGVHIVAKAKVLSMYLCLVALYAIDDPEYNAVSVCNDSIDYSRALKAYRCMEKLRHSPDYVAKLVDAEKLMVGWVATSKAVSVGSQRRVARYSGQKKLKMGVVLGDGYIKEYGTLGKYFEVVLTELDTKEQYGTGLTIGVTASIAERLKRGEPPEAAQNVPDTWAFGMGKKYWKNGQISSSDWDETKLKLGDAIGILVEPSGQIVIYVNSAVAWIEPDSKIPPTLKLTALVDLQGRAKEVKFVPTASPVGKPSAAKSNVLATRPMTGFSLAACGQNVKIDASGLVASATRSGDNVVLGNGVVPTFDKDEAYFEVLIESIEKGSKDGMAIGVTTAVLSKPPSTCDLIKPIWVVGFDGISYDSPKDKWTPVLWNPAKCKAKDSIGCRVRPDGKMEILHNKKVVASISNLPKGKTFYAVIDLIGCTKSIQFVKGARPPESRGVASPVIKVHGSSQKASDQQARSIDVSRDKTLRLSSRDRRTPSTTSNSSRGARSEKDGCTGGFHPTAHGKNVKISSNDLSASRSSNASESELNSLILGKNAALPLPDGGYYFEVKIDKVSTKAETMKEGFVIGFTQQSPTAKKSVPETADLLSPSWLVGFDGTTWNGKDWGLTNWDPRKVVANDLVGARVSPKGVLTILVNRVEVGGNNDWPKGIPASSKEPLYPVIDLLGGAVQGVIFRPGARPDVERSSVSRLSIKSAGDRRRVEARRRSSRITLVSDPLHQAKVRPSTPSRRRSLGELPSKQRPDEMEKRKRSALRPPSRTLRRRSSASTDPQATSSVSTLKVSARAGVWDEKKIQFVTFSGEGNSIATFKREGTDAQSWGGGVVFGRQALKRAANGDTSFSIKVEGKNARGRPHFFACGVTTTPPSLINTLPRTADMTPESWLVGFDGATWANGEWGLGRLDDDQVHTGDMLRLSISDGGGFELFVNKVSRERHEFKIPSDKPLYAVVDLAGLVNSVSLRSQ